MSHFVIEGGRPLHGTIPVYGSKNAALPLLAASILVPDTVRLNNIPSISDANNLIAILETLGAKVVRSREGEISLTAATIDEGAVPHDTVKSLRGSILLLGALLARNKKVTLPLPGGDVIGARPIDVHLDAFTQLGAKVTTHNQVVTIDGSAVTAGRVILSEFSVTATENILLLAASLPGTTTIEIAAAEPHVVALAELLTQMGATIEGAGTHTITVNGTSSLHGASYTNIPDMLEAGTFIIMAAAAQSEVTITNVPTNDLLLFFKKLDEIGVHYQISGTSVTVKPAPLKSFNLKTLIHPGVATDLQAPFSILAICAQGSSLIHDPLYEERFRHVRELQKMGANITVCDPHRIIIQGPTKLVGRRIPSLDIRSGATLILAGLVAEGTTIIENAEIVDRGYAELVERLTAIGAKITREGAINS